MPLRRTIVILAGAAATMLTVAMLRAETAHLHYVLSQLDRRAGALRQELREKQLELARLRNPAKIRSFLEAAGERSPAVKPE